MGEFSLTKDESTIRQTSWFETEKKNILNVYLL